MVAEIGGMSGLLLGFSVFEVSRIFTNTVFMMLKVVKDRKTHLTFSK